MKLQAFLKKAALKNQDEYIEKTWDKGGMSGGNCWGDEPHPYLGEEEPEFTALDSILESVCPNISFLTYKKLGSIIEETEKSHREYYGNFSTTGIKRIKAINLYNFLKEHKVI